MPRNMRYLRCLPALPGGGAAWTELAGAGGRAPGSGSSAVHL